VPSPFGPEVRDSPPHHPQYGQAALAQPIRNRVVAAIVVVVSTIVDHLPGVMA
jgi:hypothetical protein